MEDQERTHSQEPVNAVASESDAPMRQNEWEGRWERKGKSPLAASIITLIAAGGGYLIGQVLLTIPVVIIAMLSQGALTDDRVMQDITSGDMSALKHHMLAVMLIAQCLFFLGVTVFIVRRFHTSRVKEYLGLARAKMLDVALAVCAAIAMFPLGNWLMAVAQDFINRFINLPNWMNDISNERFAAHSFPEFLWMAVVIAVTPAVCEEVLFRGYVQRTMARKVGFHSVWIAGLLFSLFHFQAAGFFPLALTGAILGFFAYRSNNIIPSMAAHFANNFLAVLVVYLQAKLFGYELASADASPSAWVIASAVATTGVIMLYYMVTRKQALAVNTAQ